MSPLTPLPPRTRYVAAMYRLLDEYVAEVSGSELSEASQYDYVYFATCFVRWLNNDYTPGQGLS